MSYLLSIVFGTYLMAAGLGLMMNRESAQKIMDEYERSPALCYLGGAIIMMAGVALVMTHNIWGRWPEVMITLFGWGAAIEGALLLIYPKALFGLARVLTPPEKFIPVIGLASILLGAAMIWV